MVKLPDQPNRAMEKRNRVRHPRILYNLGVNLGQQGIRRKSQSRRRKLEALVKRIIKAITKNEGGKDDLRDSLRQKKCLVSI